MYYWVRQNNRVIGPFPKETVERWIHLNILTSLDEVSTDQQHWEVLRKSAFWSTPKVILKEVPRVEHVEAVEEIQAADEPSIISSLEARGEAVRSDVDNDVNDLINQLKASLEVVEQEKAKRITPSATSTSFGDEFLEHERDGGEDDTTENYFEPEDVVEPVYQLKTFQEELEEQKATTKQGVNVAMKEFSFSKSVFGSLFSWEAPAELKEIFEGRRLTPSNFSMPRTWLWGRVLLASIGLALLLGIMARYNALAIPGFGLLSAFSVPVAITILFLELDVTRSVSIWRVICGFIIGGVLSLIITQLIHTLPVVEELTDLLKASVAGLTEEPAKALILLFLVHNEKRYPYVLNGVLWGAVVGAGFAAFENAGYVLLLGGDYTELYWLALIRSVLSPFMHIVWTAAIGGAFWMARGLDAFEMGKCLFSWRVLGTLAISIGLHMLWNSGRGFSIIGITFFAIAGWKMVIYFLNVGYKQLRAL